MIGAAGEDIQARQESGKEAKMKTFDQGHEKTPRTSSGNYREFSYMVLFIAAVFLINAMETGSYRTPWPVAIITSIMGFGLFCYSWYLQSRIRK